MPPPGRFALFPFAWCRISIGCALGAAREANTVRGRAVRDLGNVRLKTKFGVLIVLLVVMSLA